MDTKTKGHTERAVNRIHKAIWACEYEKENAVRDMLADIRHFCDNQGLDFAYEDGVAYRNYAAERQDDGGTDA